MFLKDNDLNLNENTILKKKESEKNFSLHSPQL